jgi:DNA-binding NarL/FixJ family response regulator
MRFSGFILAIDSYLVRKGLISLLSRIQGVRIVREFSAADTFQQYANRQDIDFLVISQSIFDQSSTVFVSFPGLLERTILLKEEPVTQMEVHNSIHLSEGKEVLTGKIKRLMDLHASSLSSSNSLELTQREKTIVRQVSLGLTNKQIAEELFLSTHTVTTHRRNISSKLGIKSVSGLTVYAIVNNIITIEEVSLKPSE